MEILRGLYQFDIITRFAAFSEFICDKLIVPYNYDQTLGVRVYFFLSFQKNDENSPPSSSARAIHIAGKARLPSMSFSRSLHTSAFLRVQKKDDSESSDSDPTGEQLLDNETKAAADSAGEHEQMKPSMRAHKVKLTDEAEIIWDHQEKLNAQQTYVDYYPEQQKFDPLKGMRLRILLIIEY